MSGYYYSSLLVCARRGLNQPLSLLLIYPQEIFNTVKERNRKMTLRADYTEEWYQKLYESCITSYHGYIFLLDKVIPIRSERKKLTSVF